MDVCKAPFCVWGDAGMSGMILYSPSATTPGALSSAPSIEEWTRTTAKFRNDIRVRKKGALREGSLFPTAAQAPEGGARMSYNQPPPQPGPYGGEPNPYGGQQPHPYARQPGYGHPQQGGPVPYATQPGPYGRPPLPPPSGGGNGKGKAAALAGASVVLLGAIVLGAMLLTTGGEGDHSGSGKAMKLVTPHTLDGGTYVLDKDTAALKEEGTSVQDGMPAGATSVLARYKRTDAPDGRSGLAFSGAYGKIGDPRQVQEDMFKGFEANTKVTVQKKRREYLPNGSGGPSIQCEVVKLAAATQAVYVPVCTWAERSDAAMVMDVDSEKTSLKSVDVAAFAKVTAGIYRDTRRPA